MSSKAKYTVILPTYNERRNLPISKLTQILAGFPFSLHLHTDTCLRSHLAPQSYLYREVRAPFLHGILEDLLPCKL